MAIRYDKNFNKEIQKVVKNFNAKITRLEATEQEILPEKTSIKELKTIYQDRRQLKRKLKQLRKFSEKGMEKVLITPGGAEMTQWEFETGKADYAMIKRRLGKKVKAEGVIKSPYLKREETQNAIDKLEEMKKSFKNLSQSELETVKNVVDKEIKNRYYEDIFKRNFLTKFETTLKDGGYPPEIIEQFNSMSGEELLMMYRKEQAIQDIMEFSDTLGMKPGIKEVKSKIYTEATISKSQFDAIVEQMVNNLPRYLRDYKK